MAHEFPNARKLIRGSVKKWRCGKLHKWRTCNGNGALPLRNDVIGKQYGNMNDKDEHQQTIAPSQNPHRPRCIAPAGLEDRQEASVARGGNSPGTPPRHKPMNSATPLHSNHRHQMKPILEINDE